MYNVVGRLTLDFSTRERERELEHFILQGLQFRFCRKKVPSENLVLRETDRQLFNAEMSPARDWKVPRSQEAGGGGL